MYVNGGPQCGPGCGGAGSSQRRNMEWFWEASSARKSSAGERSSRTSLGAILFTVATVPCEIPGLHVWLAKAAVDGKWLLRVDADDLLGY
jgi:hypothetical protein